MKPKARIVQTESQYMHIPADCREQRILNSFDPNIPFLLNNDILWVGSSSLTEGYLVDRYCADTHLILYTVDGQARLKTADRQEQLLKKGDVLIAPAKCAYSYWVEKQQWDIIWLHLFATPRWNKPFGSSLQHHKACCAIEMQSEVEGYIREANRRHPDSARALRSFTDLIVFYIQRELGKHTDTDSPENLLSIVWAEVQQNIARHWAVDDLAKLANMSRTRFYKTVKTQTGSSPNQILNTLRMEQAGAMLLYTDYTMTSIAEAVGYEDQFSFSKAFKRYAGVSPREFKSQKGTSEKSVFVLNPKR